MQVGFSSFPNQLPSFASENQELLMQFKQVTTLSDSESVNSLSRASAASLKYLFSIRTATIYRKYNYKIL